MALDLRTGDSSAVAVINSLLEQAVEVNASDIHLEPSAKEVRVRLRIDGLLHELQPLPLYLQAPLTARIKVMAGMDVAEKRLPQDGRMDFRRQDEIIDVRVSTFPTVNGEKINLRLLYRRIFRAELADLGFSAYNLKLINKLIQRSNGLIIVTGPTGSGKTTTLYAMLAVLNTSQLNIVTIEDPVEYLLPGVNQLQVNTKAGLTFVRGLRAALRQDPDVIMVGEIRDRETAATAVRAAVTGHLVLTTMHAVNAAGAAYRLLDMGIEPYYVGSALAGIIAQRLVRCLCPDCRQSLTITTPSPEKLGEWTAAGCKNCAGRGYRGRTAVQEVMVCGERVRHLLLKAAPPQEVQVAALEEGMCPLLDDCRSKVTAGITTWAEVERVL